MVGSFGSGLSSNMTMQTVCRCIWGGGNNAPKKLHTYVHYYGVNFYSVVVPRVV